MWAWEENPQNVPFTSAFPSPMAWSVDRIEEKQNTVSISEICKRHFNTPADSHDEHNSLTNIRNQLLFSCLWSFSVIRSVVVFVGFFCDYHKHIYIFFYFKSLWHTQYALLCWKKTLPLFLFANSFKKSIFFVIAHFKNASPSLAHSFILALFLKWQKIFFLH